MHPQPRQANSTRSPVAAGADRLTLTSAERLAIIAERRGQPLIPDAETARQLERGKLEQTCRSCGRWEAAHFACSWCQRPTGPEDWYRNGNLAERHGRMPATPPADPPLEYRNGRDWPAKWGGQPICAEGPTDGGDPPSWGGVWAASRVSAPEAPLTLGLGGLA